MNEPLIFLKVKNIMKSKTPVIVARALNNHLNEKKESDIIGFFRNNLKFNHNVHKSMFNPNYKLNNCPCEYCNKFKEYVALKLCKHKVKKAFYNDYYFYTYSNSYECYEDFISAIEILDNKIARAKRVKDDLKSKLGLV